MMTETHEPSARQQDQLETASDVIRRAAEQCLVVAEALDEVTDDLSNIPAEPDRRAKARERRKAISEKLQTIVDNMVKELDNTEQLI